jgi:preprotein translocase SecE subunit
VAKKSSTEKEIEKSPEPGKKKDNSDSGKDKRNLSKSFEDFKQFLKDSLTELKKIQWPGRRQATGETIVVIITVFFFIALVTLYDKLLTFLFSFIFK